MSNSYFPEDLLVLVLKQLPLKSLGRCKMVSKSWNVLISSSEFIRFHLEYQSSIQEKLYRLLTKVTSHRMEASYSQQSHETHLAEYSINGENLGIGCQINRLYNPYERHAPGMTSMLVGSCNGLLCQTLSHGRNFKEHSIYGEYEISLCNPLIKASWVLPKSPLFLKDGRRRRVAFYGFGYDDVHHTYKVFLGSGPPHDEYKYGPDNQPDAKYEYEVYSLRSNKWIIVRPDLDFHDYFIYCPSRNLDGVLINCALHWILRNYQNEEMNHILAFDLRVDKLNILPLPEDVEYVIHDMLLSVLNGCLLLSDKIDKSGPKRIVDMWMMKDYSLKGSWTRIRIRNSSYHLCSITPVALLEDNHHHKRKLIYHDTSYWDSRGSGMILLNYDLKSHQVVEIPTPPSAVCFHHEPKQLQFVASLVQPHPPSYEDKKIYTRVKKTIIKHYYACLSLVMWLYYACLSVVMWLFEFK